MRNLGLGLLAIVAVSGVFAQNAAPPPPAPSKAPAKRLAPAAVPSYKDLKYPALHPIQVPNVETVTLPNGMRLYLLEDHELPLVNGTALVRTGNLFDPRDKIGLAGITGTVIRTGGTASKTGDQLDQQLENVAASVESNIGETSGAVSFSALKENTDTVLAIFKDVLTNPEFRQEKLDLAKSQMRSGIARRNDNAGGVSQREFTNILYGRDNPYGWQEEYATIDRINRSDLQEFYKRYFFPANVMLAIRGDFDAAAMKADIQKLFADWTVQQPPVPPFPKVTGSTTGGIYLANKSDVTQTFFAIGQLGGELKDKDLPALEIMSDILGGGFQSRLVQRVRTRMGNAYDISADWGANYDHPGLFEISGSTKSMSTVETIQAIREEVDKIRTTEVTEAELKTAKDTALNSLVFAFDTKAKTLSRILTYEYYGYPKDFIQQYQKALEAVTRADVLRAAKERLDPSKFTIVAVGNPQDFGVSLDKLGGTVTPIDLTIAPPKPQAAKSDSGSLDKGKQLLQRVQEAVGGADKLASIRDFTLSADYQFAVAAGGILAKEVDRWASPSGYRQDSTLPNGKIIAYWDGKYGWFSTPQGTANLVDPQLAQMRGDLFRLYFRLWLSDRIDGRKVNAIADDTLEISEAGGQIAKLVVDLASGLPSKVLYETARPTGPPALTEEDLSDYRDIGGIKLPYKTVILQGGQKIADVVVAEYRMNTGLKVADLEKRP